MEPLYEVLLSRTCECLINNMGYIGGDEGIVGVGGRWSVRGCVRWRCII